MSNQKEKKIVVYEIRIKNRKGRNHGENLVATFASAPPTTVPGTPLHRRSARAKAR